MTQAPTEERRAFTLPRAKNATQPTDRVAEAEAEEGRSALQLGSCVRVRIAGSEDAVRAQVVTIKRDRTAFVVKTPEGLLALAFSLVPIAAPEPIVVPAIEAEPMREAA